MYKKVQDSGLHKSKDSILFKLLLPTIAVMLMQAVILGLVLFTNGTVDSLEQNAKDSLVRDAETRSTTLENMMVRTWTNIDKLETDILDTVDNYLEQNRLALDTMLNTAEHKQAIFAVLSARMLDTIQLTSTSGAFVFLFDETTAGESAARLDGLYYRDDNPGMPSADYADMSLVIGPVEIARRANVQLASLWSGDYTCEASNKTSWDALFAPVKAAAEHPELRTKDLSFWSAPHYLHNSRMDTEICITYTRPLLYNGQVIGVFGTEMRLKFLEQYFPADDVGRLGGYILAHKISPQATVHSIYSITGSYIKRLGGIGERISLKQSNEPGISTVNNSAVGSFHAAVRPLKLYNSNTPFSDEVWSLMAIAPDKYLFVSADKVRTGIFQSSGLALALGSVLLFITIRLTTKPLLSIAGQLVTGGPNDPVIIRDSKTYEVMLLCNTINEMKARRKDTENALRAERERYMIALESATDTFIEYDIASDRFMIYSFAEENQKQVLTSKVIENFKQEVLSGHVCHPTDAQRFLTILHAGEKPAAVSQPNMSMEVRVLASLFTHLAEELTDNGYYWFLFKAVPVANEDDGIVDKTIGSARQITTEKMEALARLEAGYRDCTTGLYSRDYGERILSRMPDSIIQAGRYCVLHISLDRFDRFETHYGQVFCSMILRELSKSIKDCPRGVARDAAYYPIRWNNDEFVIICCGFDPRIVRDKFEASCQTVYTGENTELVLHFTSKAYGDITTFLAAHTTHRPPSFAVDVTPETAVGFAFDIFEHTADLDSVLQMLFHVLGDVFTLDRALICEYDQDFGANHLRHWWSAVGGSPHQSDTLRFTQADFANLKRLLGESDLFTYTSETAVDFTPGVQNLLFIPPNMPFSGICCALYESGKHVGHVLFITADTRYDWSYGRRHALNEITKIISTHFSLARSNSASRAKSEFLSRMSHEIRTPMNAILGMTKIAKDAGQDADRIESCLDKIDFSAKHLLSLINDILDMSRIESGKITIDAHPYNMRELVESLESLMRPQIESKGVTFKVVCDIAKPRIRGDEQKLRQVLINLLGNAGKFTSAGDCVTLTVQQALLADGICTMRISVEDTGMGIIQEDQAKIFNAFEQSTSGLSSTVHAKGTGLGLAISSGFIAAMGGKIELISELGVGANFFFTLRLPYEKDDEGIMSIDAQPTAETIGRFKDRRVLIVDDTAINLEIASYLVESVGFDVETAMDGREAVDMFFDTQPGYYDVIFMDINMPVMDGLEATREIRRNLMRPDAQTIPIIAMTANAFSDDTRKSIESGMNAHVAKPIDTELLYTTLEKLLL